MKKIPIKLKKLMYAHMLKKNEEVGVCALKIF
jgi:hypothetical protein